MSWYDLDLNVARVCTNKAWIYSIKQGLSRFEHDLQNGFHTIVVRFQVQSSTVCYSQVQLNTTFTRLTGHLQGLHTFPPTFVRVMLHTIYIMTRLSSLVEWTSCVVVYICSCKVSHGLSRSCTIANTIIHRHGTRVSFLNVLKIIHGFHGYTRTAQV